MIFWLYLMCVNIVWLEHFIIVHVQKEVDQEKGAVKAVQDLYDVVRYDVLSINMR